MKTSVVANITNNAHIALKVLGIHAEYGYGDVYHFDSRVPQKTSVDIATHFTIEGIVFEVTNGVLDTPPCEVAMEGN